MLYFIEDHGLTILGVIIALALFVGMFFLLQAGGDLTCFTCA